MFRFLALTWNPDDNDSGALARKLRTRHANWSAAVEKSGLLVLHVDSRQGASAAHVLETNTGSGVVLGTLFGSLDAAESAAVFATRGKRLIERYWGRYVALLAPANSKLVLVIRDPTGGLPCLTTTHQRLRLFFSCASDVAQLGLLSVSVNWNFVAAHVCQPRLLHTAKTGLNEVSEVLPGECFEIRADQSIVRNLYWNPGDIVRSARVTSLEEATARLRDTVRHCVAAWRSCYPRAIHLLSGGLDSSIVLRCLQDVTALTFFNTLSPHSDERSFARQVVKGDLLEIEEIPEHADLRIVINAACSPRPWDVQYYQTHGTYERRALQQTSANAIFSGHGGDHIFLQGPLTLAAADYVHDHGINHHVPHLCAQIARAEGASIWSVLNQAIQRGLGWQPWRPDIHIRRMRLVTPEVALLARQSGLQTPPWLNAADMHGRSRLPWGKLEHIRMASVRQDFYEPFATRDSPERIAPLISQPIIELCLRTPTYMLTHQACDRFLARQAFSDSLPASIVWRRAKGSADAYIHRLLTHSLPFARELMLDGVLISNGYLDRSKVERTLSGPNSMLSPDAAELVVFHLSTEAWLKGLHRWQPSHP